MSCQGLLFSLYSSSEYYGKATPWMSTNILIVIHIIITQILSSCFEGLLIILLKLIFHGNSLVTLLSLFSSVASLSRTLFHSKPVFFLLRQQASYCQDSKWQPLTLLQDISRHLFEFWRENSLMFSSKGFQSRNHLNSIA